MTRILLSGSCGYVGSKLLPKLRDAGNEVISVDQQWFGKSHPVLWRDIRTLPALEGADVIIHLAAISNDPTSSSWPRLSWETGPLAVQQLCQLAEQTGARFIYASSVSVYGADRGQVTEDMSLHPVSDYNENKMVAERVLLSYPHLKPQIIRPATICGLSPRMRLDLTVNLFVAQAMENGVITVHGGEQYRPSIHIDDMVDLYLYMLDHPELTGIWNAGFENHKLIDIANLVAEYTGARVEILPIKDVRSYQVNSQKLLDTGFRPKKGIRDAIAELIYAYKTGFKRDSTMVNLTRMQELGIQDV